MSVAHRARRLLWKLGYDVSRMAPAFSALERRRRLLRHYEIDTVLDVGANAGQFARELREDLGYAGRILSFEPLAGAFAALRSAASGDPRWEAFNFALGEAAEKMPINVSANSLSSSFLAMLPAHLASAPASRYVSTEVVEVRTLDAVFGELCAAAANVYLKIDAQGFERKVLKGAQRSLARIDTIQMELSLVPLYEGEPLFPDMLAFMQERGYRLVGLESGFADEQSGHLLQLDGIFRRLPA